MEVGGGHFFPVVVGVVVRCSWLNVCCMLLASKMVLAVSARKLVYLLQLDSFLFRVWAIASSRLPLLWSIYIFHRALPPLGDRMGNKNMRSSNTR